MSPLMPVMMFWGLPRGSFCLFSAPRRTSQFSLSSLCSIPSSLRVVRGKAKHATHLHRDEPRELHMPRHGSVSQELLSLSIAPGKTLKHFFTRYDNILWNCADSGIPLPNLQMEFHTILRALALPMAEQQHLLRTAGQSQTIGEFQKRVALYIGEQRCRPPPPLPPSSTYPRLRSRGRRSLADSPRRFHADSLSPAINPLLRACQSPPSAPTPRNRRSCPFPVTQTTPAPNPRMTLLSRRPRRA